MGKRMITYNYYMGLGKIHLFIDQKNKLKLDEGSQYYISLSIEAIFRLVQDGLVYLYSFLTFDRSNFILI